MATTQPSRTNKFNVTESAAVGEMPTKRRVYPHKGNVSATSFLISQIGFRIAIQTRKLAHFHIPRDCNAQLYGPYRIFLSTQKSPSTGLFTSAYVKEIEISPVSPDFRQALLPEQNKKVMITSKSRQNGSEMIIKKPLFDQSQFILNHTSFCVNLFCSARKQNVDTRFIEEVPNFLISMIAHSHVEPKLSNVRIPSAQRKY